MARPLEERGYFVREDDPATPIHCKVSRAAGLIGITEAEARLLSSARRVRASAPRTPGPEQGTAPGPVELPDLRPALDAIAHLAQRVAALETRPDHAGQASAPDLKPLAEAVLALGRRIEAVEQEIAGLPVLVAELFQRARAEEGGR